MRESNNKSERLVEPPTVLWEEAVAKYTEGNLPSGYHVEHYRFGDDDRFGMTTTINTRGACVSRVVYKDMENGYRYASYRNTASLLVRKSLKNFLKRGC